MSNYTEDKLIEAIDAQRTFGVPADQVLDHLKQQKKIDAQYIRFIIRSIDEATIIAGKTINKTDFELFMELTALRGLLVKEEYKASEIVKFSGYLRKDILQNKENAYHLRLKHTEANCRVLKNKIQNLEASIESRSLLKNDLDLIACYLFVKGYRQSPKKVVERFRVLYPAC